MIIKINVKDLSKWHQGRYSVMYGMLEELKILFTSKEFRFIYHVQHESVSVDHNHEHA